MLAAMFNLLIWAQVGPKGTGFPAGGQSTPGADGLLGGGIVMVVVYLLLVGFMLFCMWQIFVKAGEPGWAAIVPIYNVMILSKICGRGEVFGLLLFVPCVGIVIAVLLALDLAKVFGKSAGFGIGLLLLGIVFYPMLAFGSAEYVGADGRSPGRRRRRGDEDDEDEDDDEEDERPRRPAPKDPRTQQRPSAPPPAAPKRRPPVEDDDDEEEERPRPKRR